MTESQYIPGGWKIKNINKEYKIQKAVGKLSSDVTMSCSRLAALQRKNPYSSPNDELQKSIDALAHDYVRKEINNDAIQLGNNLEPVNLAFTAEKLGIVVETQILESIKHKELPLQGSLDGVGIGKEKTIITDKDKGIFVMGQDSIDLNGPGVIEAKLTGTPPKDTPDDFRGPIQVQGLMMCLDCKWGAVAIIYQGIHHKVYIYSVNERLQAKIKEDVIGFQERIDLYKRDQVTDWYPVFNPSDGSKTYKIDNGLESIVLSEEDEVVAKKILNINTTIKDAEIEKAEATTYLMDRLGNHSTGVGKELTIEWGNSSARKSYTVAEKPEARSKTIKIKPLALVRP